MIRLSRVLEGRKNPPRLQAFSGRCDVFVFCSPRAVASSMKYRILHFLIIAAFLFTDEGRAQTQPPRITAPITAETLGVSGPQASTSVVRISCWGTHPGPFQKLGTGFLHKSGVVITAKHILSECRTKDFRLTLSSTRHIKVAAETDPAADLALLRPAEKLAAAPLSISSRASIDVGQKLYVWGFPDGYSLARPPLLINGYLSGIDTARTDEPLGWIVNAPFRSGTSGGPVISANDGLVIGVVSSTINYFPTHLTDALKSLSTQRSGPKYTLPTDDGSTIELTETQVIADILGALRRDHDRLLGFAVSSTDLRNFLKSKNIDP